jgi:hypothetical protein
MQEHFVNYTQALALKELGFTETSFAGYELIENGELWIGNIGGSEQFNREYYIPAPLKSQVFKWFRDQGFDFAIMDNHKDLGKFYGGYIKEVNKEFGKSFGSNFSTYEEAESACIDRLISLISK